MYPEKPYALELGKGPRVLNTSQRHLTASDSGSLLFISSHSIHKSRRGGYPSTNSGSGHHGF
jgi:hypothetical protein